MQAISLPFINVVYRQCKNAQVSMLKQLRVSNIWEVVQATLLRVENLTVLNPSTMRPSSDQISHCLCITSGGATFPQKRR